MMIFGSIGRIGSGKDEVIKYLDQKYDIPMISVGDTVREMAANGGIPLTRENLHRISSESIEKYGKEYFMSQVLNRIRSQHWEQAGISGVRTPDDIRFLRERLGKNAIIVRVYVNDPRVRFQRVRNRKSQRDPQTYEDFLAQDSAEERLFHIDEASAMADYALDNSGNLEDLHRQIDDLIAKEVPGLMR